MEKQIETTKRTKLHIVGKCIDKQWPGLTQRQAWQVFSKVLKFLEGEEEGLITHAFVLMNNHYHWICSCDYNSQTTLFEWFHECVQVEFLHKSQTYTGHFFEAPPTVMELNRFVIYQQAYKYVYANPVTAGLVEFAQEYPYSTLYYLLRGKKLKFVCEDNMGLANNPFRILDWVNLQLDLFRYH